MPSLSFRNESGGLAEASTASAFPLAELVETPEEPEFDPLAIEGLMLWLDASNSESLTLDGTSVLVWDDLSGNDRHVEALASYEPTLATEAVNGLDAIEYYQTATMLTGASAFNGGQSIFLVYSDASTNAWCTPLGTNGAAWGWIHGNLDNTSIFSALYTDPDMLSGAHLKNGIDVDWTITPRPTGVSCMSYIASSPLTASHLSTIGADNLSGAYARSIEGYLCEVLIYDSALSMEDRQEVEGYLMAKWGIS